MRHERHFIDGDQLSPVKLKRIIGEIGYRDNVAITIVHNGLIGNYCTQFASACKSTGVTLIESPKVKNGADFIIMAEVGQVIGRKYDSDLFLHTNDISLGDAFLDFAHRKFYTASVVPLIS